MPMERMDYEEKGIGTVDTALTLWSKSSEFDLTYGTSRAHFILLFILFLLSLYVRLYTKKKKRMDYGFK